MPIITLQRRLRQVGRIRIGATVATSNGKTRPVKLERFRFTSPDREAIELVAETYGGVAKAWDGASVGEQWEVYAETKELDIVIPPSDIAFSQWFELWKGGGCHRRCDGVRDILNDCACECDPENTDCKPTTRLNVILQSIEGVGVWRLETHGYNSASELSGAVEVLESIHSKKVMVPGRLLLEQRQSKKIDPSTGKAVTYNYAVPVIDFSTTSNFTPQERDNVLSEVAESTVIPHAIEKINLEDPRQRSDKRFIAMEDIMRDEDVPSIVEQIAVSEDFATLKAIKPSDIARKSAAAKVKPTGILPRRIDEVEETTTTNKTAGGTSLASLRKLMALIAGSSIQRSTEARHAWASEFLGYTITSFSDLSQHETSQLIEALTQGEEDI